jgi:hypothetical protein
MIITQQKTKGFSLIEAIVAVTLMSVAIVGPMTLSAQSIRATREARLELIATHLAEEGMETVHNIRDNNSAKDATLTRLEWMDGGASHTQLDILNQCSHGDGCIVDITEHPGAGVGAGTGVWTDATLVRCNGICDDVIYQNPTTGLYRQNKAGLTTSWIASPFKRVVHVTGVDHPQNPVRQVRVVSTVTYQAFNGETRTISVNEDYYNWFPALN